MAELSLSFPSAKSYRTLWQPVGRRKKRYPVLLFLCPMLISGICLAQDEQNACPSEQKDVDAVTQKYKGIFSDLQSQGDKLKNSDDAKKFSVEFTWADTAVTFSTPSVTVDSRELIFDLPQVTLRKQEIVFSTPSIRIEERKTGQFPELTCHDTWIKIGPIKTKGVPECTTTWHDIKTNVPVPFMQEQHISLDIPEFTFAKTRTTVSVPEFSMQEQKVVFGVPQVKTGSVLLNAKPLKEKADQLSNKAQEAKTAEAKELGQAVHTLFDCYRANLQQQRTTAEQQFSAAIAQLDGAIQSIRNQGADPTSIPQADGTRTDLVQQLANLTHTRDEILGQFDEGVAELDASENETTKKIGQ